MSTSFICTITGNPIEEEPVVSIKTGHIYEKRIIQKHIDALGADPITGEESSIKDYITIQNNTKVIKPRSINQTGVPQMIKNFQNEWDALMLEVFSLKQHLQTVRQELSHALYQHDASCRVIARLMKEKEELKQALQYYKLNGKQSEMEQETEQQEQQGYLSQDLQNEINETSIQLNQKRKEFRKLKDQAFIDYADINSIQKFTLKLNIPLHSTTKTGLNCLDIIDNQEQRYIVTGGNDTNIILFDRLEQQIVQNLTGHSKKINDVVFLSKEFDENINIFSCSEDATAKLFQYNFESQQQKILYDVKAHKAPLTSCAIHPTGLLGVVCARDNEWSFHDLNQGKQLSVVKEFEDNLTFHSIRFHPDGHLLGAGSNDGSIKIWNVVDDSTVATLQGHKGPVDRISFSENGFYFASSSTEEGIVKIWDLRHLKIIKQFYEGENKKVGSLAFDQSGQYLAIGSSSDISIFSTKSWDKFAELQGHKDLVSCLKFGYQSKFLASGSQDRHLNIYQ